MTDTTETRDERDRLAVVKHLLSGADIVLTKVLERDLTAYSTINEAVDHARGCVRSAVDELKKDIAPLLTDRLRSQPEGEPDGGREALDKIASMIRRVERRAMAADGPVTPTTQEMTEDELRRIYKLATDPQPTDRSGEGAARIAAERERQIAEEGWDAEHDDGHDGGELAMAAACCALSGTEAYPVGPDWTAETWMEELAAKHADDPIRALEIAGALIAAEIDRVLRERGMEEAGRALMRSDPSGRGDRPGCPGRLIRRLRSQPEGEPEADATEHPDVALLLAALKHCWNEALRRDAISALNRLSDIPVPRDAADPEPDGGREAGPSRHELAGALASVLSSAGFVEPMHDGTGWWECRACEAQGEGPGEIEHLPKCPEAVEQRYRETLPDPQPTDRSGEASMSDVAEHEVMEQYERDVSEEIERQRRATPDPDDGEEGGAPVADVAAHVLGCDDCRAGRRCDELIAMLPLRNAFDTEKE